MEHPQAVLDALAFHMDGAHPAAQQMRPKMPSKEAIAKTVTEVRCAVRHCWFYAQCVCGAWLLACLPACLPACLLACLPACLPSLAFLSTSSSSSSSRSSSILTCCLRCAVRCYRFYAQHHVPCAFLLLACLSACLPALALLSTFSSSSRSSSIFLSEVRCAMLLFLRATLRVLCVCGACLPACLPALALLIYRCSSSSSVLLFLRAIRPLPYACGACPPACRRLRYSSTYGCSSTSSSILPFLRTTHHYAVRVWCVPTCACVILFSFSSSSSSILLFCTHNTSLCACGACLPALTFHVCFQQQS